MANVIYVAAKVAALQAGMGLTGDVRFILVDLADYNFNSAHDFLDDVPAISRVAVTPSGAASKTYTGGTFDTADFSWLAVTGDQSEAIICYVHTGTESTSRLIFFMDTGVTGLPVTPNGGDIAVAVNASGWFAL